MAPQQEQSTEEQHAEPESADDEARHSFDTWQHTTMLGTDDSDGPSDDNVIRGID